MRLCVAINLRRGEVNYRDVVNRWVF